MRKAPPLPADDIKELSMGLKDFRLGSVALLGENRTPPAAMIESLNAIQIADGIWRKKWGADYYNQEMESERGALLQTITNMVTNPSFANNTTGWAAGTDTTITRVTTEAFQGAASLRAVGTSITSAKFAFTAVVGTAYAARARVKGTAGTVVHIRALNGSIGANYTLTGGWDLIEHAFVATNTSSDIEIRANVATTIYIDCAMIQAGVTSVSDYFDGSHADTDDTDYSWTGAAHASTSIAQVYEYEPLILDGAFAYVRADESEELLEVAGGKLFWSEDAGAKTEVTITGGSLDAGYPCFFFQDHGYVYITNYHDNLVRFDVQARTASSYTALATPIAPTAALTGLTSGNYKAHYVIVASNSVGTTVGSPELAQSVNLPRDQWVPNKEQQNATNYVTLTITRVTNATRYSIFYSDESGRETYLDSVPDPGSGTTFTWIDRGEIPTNDFIELPEDNTTGGPILGPMEDSGNRMWSIDSNKAVVWGGVGQYSGIFSPFYGGGYVYLAKGGREKPVAIKHFRSGRGDAGLLVFTTDPDGNGSTWQVTLETVTVGSVSFIVPVPVKLPMSIGCSGPRGVVIAGDDVLFGNKKGVYSLGSVPQVLNVLATREVSANIRTPGNGAERGWRELSGAGMSNMAAYTYDAKVFFAVPYESTSNSEIWVRDIEKRNWQLAWTGVAVKAFLEHTDASGHTRLLAVPVDGSRLIELSPDIAGDFGAAFTTRLKTGILPVFPKNHNKFAQINSVTLEVGNPLGTITVDVYGYDYKKGYSYLGTLSIEGGTGTSSMDWGEEWSTQEWSYIGDTDDLEIERPSVLRRYKRFNKLVNSLQFVITTDNLHDYFELLELQADGFLVDVAPPRGWKLGSNAPALERTLEDALLDEDGGVLLDETGDPLYAT